MATAASGASYSPSSAPRSCSSVGAAAACAFALALNPSAALMSALTNATTLPSGSKIVEVAYAASRKAAHGSPPLPGLTPFHAVTIGLPRRPPPPSATPTRRAPAPPSARCGSGRRRSRRARPTPSAASTPRAAVSTRVAPRLGRGSHRGGAEAARRATRSARRRAQRRPTRGSACSPHATPRATRARRGPASAAPTSASSPARRRARSRSRAASKSKRRRVLIAVQPWCSASAWRRDDRPAAARSAVTSSAACSAPGRRAEEEAREFAACHGVRAEVGDPLGGEVDVELLVAASSIHRVAEEREQVRAGARGEDVGRHGRWQNARCAIV